MTRQIGGSSWSPDGKQIVFVANITGRNNLWLVAKEGGWPSQLTVSDQRQRQPAWSPDGKWIAYISDYDGDEQWDIFLVSPKSGQTINLTHTREISEEDPTWSPDGRYLAYLVKPKESPSYEVDVYDMVLRQVKHVTTGTAPDLTNEGLVWSPDGASIVFTQSHAKGTDSNIFIASLTTGEKKLLTPHKGEQLFNVNDVAHDGRTLLITSNALNGYNNVGLLDIASTRIDWLTREKWESSGANFSPDGKRAIWISNIEGNTQINLHDLAVAKTHSLPLPAGINLPVGSATAFSPDGGSLLFLHSGPDGPGDIWIHDFASSKSQRTTHSLLAGINPSDFVAPYLVHYPSKDGKWQISAFLYVPYNMQKNGENAAIVYVHGGPASQSVNGFSPLIQYMVNQGYMVISPNYRGSTGYGKEFQQANLFDMGGGDLQDVIDGAEWIKKTGFVDPKKIVLMGGSYGGYLTMMGVTKAPEEWAAGVPIVPFVNWFTEIENEDPSLRQSDLATMGDPVKNKSLYEERSPIFFVDKIKAPLLLLAGGNDPRCPKSEAQQVVDAIKKQGGKVEYKVYENEGHGFSRIENQIDYSKRVAEFIKAHVPPANCGCSLNE